jgi:uncharacterized surface protein with fasciclin (FAS1) repeats
MQHHMFSTLRRRSTLAGSIAVLAIGLAACGTTDDTTDTATDTATEEMEEMSSEEMEEMDSALTLEPVGEACAAIDPDGPGSSEGMASEPVATAASNNPLLTTLVAAVGAADLGDTLNTADALTVFAPYNPAFEAFTEDELAALLEDTETLTSILTLHVVGGSMTLEDLEAAGTVETLNGESLTLDFAGGVEDGLPAVSASNAVNVLCGNIQTANATVHLIDAVLLPTG